MDKQCIFADFALYLVRNADKSLQMSIFLLQISSFLIARTLSLSVHSTSGVAVGAVDP